MSLSSTKSLKNCLKHHIFKLKIFFFIFNINENVAWIEKDIPIFHNNGIIELPLVIEKEP